MLLFFESGESSLRFQGWEQEEWISQEYATVQHDSGIIIILSHWLCLGRVCVCVCSYNGVTLCFRLVEPIEVKMLNPSLKWMKLEEATRFWLNTFKNYFVLICFFFTCMWRFGHLFAGGRRRGLRSLLVIISIDWLRFEDLLRWCDLQLKTTGLCSVCLLY